MPKPPVSSENPEAIGLTTRRLVEAHLVNYPGFIPPNNFLERIQSFATELARWGTRLNLTAAPHDPAELAFHILDSLMPLLLAFRDSTSALTNAFVSTRSILDLGSGAGFPGIVLAAASEANFVLTEARRKRASFLNAAATAMNLANVRVDNHYRTVFASEFDIATARALAQPVVFYETSASALRPGGMRILYASVRQRLQVERALADRNEEASFYEYDLPRMNRLSMTSKNQGLHMLIVSRRPPT